MFATVWPHSHATAGPAENELRKSGVDMQKKGVLEPQCQIKLVIVG